MSVITIKSFDGTAPRVDPSLLQDTQATLAQNAKLWSGALMPFMAPLKDTELAKQTAASLAIYKYAANSVWLSWLEDVNVAKWPVAGDALERIVYTGTDKPRVTSNDIYSNGSPGTQLPPASYILGLPAPLDAPTAAGGAGGNINATCVYFYTFVRKWSDGSIDESGPSTTVTVTVANTHVTVGAPNTSAPTFANYGITHKRIYRAEGGDALFVAEITAATTSYDDNIATASLGAVCPSELYLPPPDGAIGAVACANGVTAMFKGNTLYLSEPYRPHAYPLANQWAFDFPIVAIGTFGQTIVCATTAYPRAVYGVDPAAMSEIKGSMLLPCLSKPSMANSDKGCLWASTDGLAYFDATGDGLLTEKLLTKSDWANFAPSTMFGAVWQGRYFGFYQTGTHSDGTPIGGAIVLDRRITLSEFVTINVVAYAAFVIKETDSMYIVLLDASDNKFATYLWDGSPTAFLDYTWRSKVFVSPEETGYGCAMVDGTFSNALTPAQQAALAAQQIAIKAANQALLNTNLRDFLGEAQLPVHPNAQNAYLQNIPQVPVGTTSLTFNYYVDDALFYSRTVFDREPFPLPVPTSMPLHHQVEVSGNMRVREITIAGSVDELARV